MKSVRTEFIRQYLKLEASDDALQILRKLCKGLTGSSDLLHGGCLLFGDSRDILRLRMDGIRDLLDSFD